MAEPAPWELGAFPELCPHCGMVKWFRPCDQSDLSDPCWAAIVAENRAGRENAASLWWQELSRVLRKQERASIAASVHSGRASGERDKIVKEIRDG